MAEEIIIGSHNFAEHCAEPVIDGERRSFGLVPRNYDTHPRGFYARIQAVDFPLIPRSEWPVRIAEKEAKKTRLSDIRMTGMFGAMIPSRDQNGRGYCWFHSGTSAMLLLRAVMNAPYADLSAYAGACIIKQFRDEGGWGAQGVDFQIERGIPTSEFWPQRSVDRANDNPKTWANAKLHRVEDGWIDLAVAQYDRKLSFEQMITCLLQDVPVVSDFNWWSHSVCSIDAVNGATDAYRSTMRASSGKLFTLHEFNEIWGVDDEVTGGIGSRILNSWGDVWSDNGMGLLAGSKAVPDGAVAPRITTPSMAA